MYSEKYIYIYIMIQKFKSIYIKQIYYHHILPIRNIYIYNYITTI